MATAVRIMAGQATLEAADTGTQAIGIEVGVGIHIEGEVGIGLARSDGMTPTHADVGLSYHLWLARVSADLLGPRAGQLLDNRPGMDSMDSIRKTNQQFSHRTSLGTTGQSKSI